MSFILYNKYSFLFIFLLNLLLKEAFNNIKNREYYKTSYYSENSVLFKQRIYIYINLYINALKVDNKFKFISFLNYKY
jgi:hypothetical protein